MKSVCLVCQCCLIACLLVLPGWAQRDVWKDLIEDFDLQESLEKGTEILQESRNAAGEAAEKLQEHGQNLMKNVRKGLLYSL